MYKLELMKMPVDVKNMNIDEYFKQVGTCFLYSFIAKWKYRNTSVSEARMC